MDVKDFILSDEDKIPEDPLIERMLEDPEEGSPTEADIPDDAFYDEDDEEDEDDSEED